MWSLEKGGGWDEKWPTSDKQSFRTTKVSIVYIVPKNYKYNVKYKDHIATKENLLLLAMLQFQRFETQ